MAQDVLASLPKHISLGLNVFCIPRAYPEADYYSIINHPQILDPVCLDALEKLVVLAKQSGEGQTAFMMAWKKVLLEGCIDKGVEKFFSEFREGGEQALQKLLWKVGPPESYMKDVPPELMRFYEESTHLKTTTHLEEPSLSSPSEEVPSTNNQTTGEGTDQDDSSGATEDDILSSLSNPTVVEARDEMDPDSTVDSVMLGLQRCVLEGDIMLEQHKQFQSAPFDTAKIEERALFSLAKSSNNNTSEKTPSSVISVCEWLDRNILDQVRRFSENDSTFQSLLLLLLRDISRFQKLAELWGSKSDSWRLNSLVLAKNEAYPFEEPHKRCLVDEVCPELQDLHPYANDFGSKFFELLFYAAQWPEDADGSIVANNNNNNNNSANHRGEGQQSQLAAAKTRASNNSHNNIDASPQKVEEEIAREKIEAEIICIRRSLKQKQQRDRPTNMIAKDIANNFGKMLEEYRFSGISNLYYIIEERERCLVDVMSENGGAPHLKSNGSSSCFLSIVEVMSGLRQHMLMRFVSKIVVLLLSTIEMNFPDTVSIKHNNEYQAIRERMKTKLADRKQQQHSNSKKGKTQQVAGIDPLECDAEYYLKHYSTLFTVDPPPLSASPVGSCAAGGGGGGKRKSKKNSPKKHNRRRR